MQTYKIDRFSHTPASGNWHEVPWDAAAELTGDPQMEIIRHGRKEMVSALGLIGTSENFFHFQVRGDATDYRIAKVAS